MVSAHQAWSESFQTFIQRVRSLKISSLVDQLNHSPRSANWTEKEMRKTIAQYFAFLYLVDHYPNLALVPTQNIDHIWQCHILDTEKYAMDCQILFNRFVHRFSFLEFSYEDDRNQFSQGKRQNNLAASVLTQVLFRKHFGCTMQQSSTVSAKDQLSSSAWIGIPR